jgi:hypothetical protein
MSLGDTITFALKQGIANKDQILADGNYTNASPDKQHAYNDAVKVSITIQVIVSLVHVI